MSFNEFLKSWVNAHQNERAEAACRLRHLMEDYPDVAKIAVDYDGCSDMRCFNVSFLDSIGNVLVVDDREHVVQSLMCLILPAGWEFDEGALGEAEICVDTDTIIITHTQRVIQLVTTKLEMQYGTPASPFNE